MKMRPILVSVAVAAVSLAGHQLTLTREVQEPRPAASGPSEPSAPLNAGAVLEAMVGTDSRPQARVRLSLTSLLSDAEAWVQRAPRRQGDPPVELGRMMLLRGQRRDMRVVVDLEPGVDNQLQFRARARRPDGTEEVQSMVLDVNLDPALQPEFVDDYMQYQGAVEPAGGVR